MQMDVPSSVVYPHQLDLWQIRQGRFRLTRWNPPDTSGVVSWLWPLVFGILRGGSLFVLHNSPLDFRLSVFLRMRFSIFGSRTPDSVCSHLRVQVVRGIPDMIR